MLLGLVVLSFNFSVMLSHNFIQYLFLKAQYPHFLHLLQSVSSDHQNLVTFLYTFTAQKRMLISGHSPMAESLQSRT